MVVGFGIKIFSLRHQITWIWSVFAAVDRLHKEGKMAEQECEIKIAVVGESGVGKSCIVSSFCSNEEGETTEGQLINI